MDKNKFCVSVAQVTPGKDNRETLGKIEQFASQAAEQQSRLVLFPEALIGGYPRGSSFGTVIGARSDDGRKEFQRYLEAAIEVPGAECDRLGEMAATNKIFIVVGVIEREGGTLYCTVLFFAPDGSMLGKHRKLMPTGSERLVWGYGDGSTMPVFDTPIGKIGAVICWENYMPLMRAAHYAKGIEIYCAPTADGRDTWLPTMRHIAIEGRCFVLSANQFARKSDYPGHYPDGDPTDIVSAGGSCIVDPFGRVLAGPDFSGEALLTAEIDRAAVIQGKFDFDVVGHYSRPDVFKLEINEKATKAVSFVVS